jgi:putative inorganic carbon (HCO3(-)) transporter
MSAALRLPPSRLWFLDPGHFFLWATVLATGLALALLPLSWIAIAVPAMVVVGAISIRPQLALYLLCFAVPFGSLLEVDLGGITVGITEGLIGLLMISWIARSIALKEIALKEGAWTRSRPSGPLLMFIGATFLSLPNATSLPLAFKEIAKWVEFLGVMLFASNAIATHQSRTVVACLLLAGVAQSIWGAYQFFTRSGPEFFMFMGRFMRAYGTFEQPNPYGGYLGLIAPLALVLALSLSKRSLSLFGRRGSTTKAPRAGGQTNAPLAPVVHRRETDSLPGHSANSPIPGWLRWLALGSFAAISVAIGMSGSRGAWMGFGAAFAAVNLASSRKGAIVFAALVLLIASIGMVGGFRLLPESIVQRLTNFVPLIGVRDIRSIEVTDANYASLERLAFWQAALDMWGDHPWLGVGFGNYQVAYADYALPKWREGLGHAHNYYLNVAAETGLIGLVSYLVLWGAALWQTAKAIRRSGDFYAKALALGALGILVHVSVHNIVDNLWVHNLYIQVAIVLGMVKRSPQTG